MTDFENREYQTQRNANIAVFQAGSLLSGFDREGGRAPNPSPKIPWDMFKNPRCRRGFKAWITSEGETPLESGSESECCSDERVFAQLSPYSGGEPKVAGTC